MKLLSEGDRVKLNTLSFKWKALNSTIPQFKIDNLKIGKEYTIYYTTPILKVAGGDQQFVSILDNGCEVLGTYPSYCFDKIK